ncbi:MAG: hypothetical protein ACYTGC_17110, partial [Planctomycetota bacterium]
SAHPDFISAMRPPMSAVCMRYAPAAITRSAAKEMLPRLHHVVVRRIEEDGAFWISTTVLKGQTWFRINPVNFRTRLEHMDGLMEALIRECERARSELLETTGAHD